MEKKDLYLSDEQLAEIEHTIRSELSIGEHHQAMSKASANYAVNKLVRWIIKDGAFISIEKWEALKKLIEGS